MIWHCVVYGNQKMSNEGALKANSFINLDLEYINKDRTDVILTGLAVDVLRKNKALPQKRKDCLDHLNFMQSVDYMKLLSGNSSYKGKKIQL